jgi:hypothetical protein
MADDDRIESIIDAVRSGDPARIGDGLAAMSEHLPDGALSGEMLAGTAILVEAFGPETGKKIVAAVAKEFTPGQIQASAPGLQLPGRPELFHEPKTAPELAEAVALLLSMLYVSLTGEQLDLEQVAGKGRLIFPDISAD